MDAATAGEIKDLYGAKFGVGALSIIGSLLASHLAHKKLEKQLESTPRISGGLAGVKKILGSQGLPNDFVVGRAPGLRNAIFSGASNPRIIDAVSQYSPDLAGKMNPQSVESASRNGMILFDPAYARAGVIAHEGGHAKIHAGGGLSGINQTYLRPVGEIVSAFSPVLGSAAGYSSASPLIGGLVGGLSGALGSIPTIVNEAQATGHAKDYLDKSRHRMSTKENSNKALSHAYFSYLTPAVISALGGAASGAIAGQIGRMEKGADYLNDEEQSDEQEIDEEEGDDTQPVIPKPVKPGLGLTAAGLGLAGLGGAMIAPSAIDSVNRFNAINNKANPLESARIYFSDGGKILNAPALGGMSTGRGIIQGAREKLLPFILGENPIHTRLVPKSLSDILGDWSGWGPEQEHHYTSFQNGILSAERQFSNEASTGDHGSYGNKTWISNEHDLRRYTDRPQAKISEGLTDYYVKKLSGGKSIKDLSPSEQEALWPQLKEKMYSTPILGKVVHDWDTRVGENIQGIPGSSGKGDSYNNFVIKPLNTIRKGLLYTGAGLATAGGAYALYRYMQHRKQKAEQKKQEQALLASYGLLPKTASAPTLPLSASIKNPVDAIDAANQVLSPAYHATNTIGNTHGAAKFIANKSPIKPVSKAIAPIVSSTSRAVSPISKAVPSLNVASMAAETAGLIAHPEKINNFISRVETQPALQRVYSGYMNPVTSIASFADQSSQLAQVTAQNTATEYNNVLKSPINTQRSESISLNKNRPTQTPSLAGSVNSGLLAPNSPKLNNLSKSGLLFPKIADERKQASSPGLWANIRAKRRRGEKPAKPGQEGYPDKKNWNKLTGESKTAESNGLNQDNIKPEGQMVPAELQEKFKPDYTPEQLQEMGVYREVYGKKDGPRLASLESWPSHWYHPEDKMGWLEWYKKYSAGRRMEDDSRQIKRWIAFKARHGGPAFQENPTPRRAYALRNWGVDPTKLVDNPQALSDAMNIYKSQKYKSLQPTKTAGIESFAKTLAEYEAKTGHIKKQLELLRNGANALQQRKSFLIPHEIETAAHGLPTSAQHLSALKDYISGRIGELTQNPYVRGLGEELHGIANRFGIK